MDLSLDTDVVAARTGDRHAFARLVTRYRGLVSSISLSTVRNVATSEDVAQDVFLAAWRDLGSLRNPSSFLPWLRQLTRHRALDVARGGRRPDRRGAVDDATLEAAVDPRPSAQDALLDDERSRTVALALDALPEDAREVLTLYYREGQSIEHVARLIGLREDTAKKRLSRARAALRDEVLARFADAVEQTTPGDRFTNRVMVALPMLSPAAAIGISKAILHLLGKWVGLALTTAAFVPILLGAVSVRYNLRRDLLAAMDQQERRQLRIIGALTLLNFLVFGLGVAALGPRLPGSHARLWFGIAHSVVFVAVHCMIYAVWLPRAQARRRRAEELADPSASARRAREVQRGRLLIVIACGLTSATLIAAWIRG
jgi:RNA polymerase sigma factor (sigma-70 family)